MASNQTTLENSRLHNLAEIEALFASIGEGLIVTNDAGMVTRINKYALDIFGYKKSEILNRQYINKVIAVYENGMPLEPIDRPIVKAFLTGKIVSDRTIYKRKDGSTVPVQLTVSPLLLKGKPIGAVQLFRDISGEVQMDKLKSDFISLASHQLRTPLSAVNIYAGMLLHGLGGPMNEQQKIFTKTILASAHRMNELIDMLLNITRIEAGGIEVRPTKINVDNLLDEIISEIMPSIEEKNINLKININDTPETIETDGLLIKEVFTNLITNAVKYTPVGGSIKITLKDDANNIIYSVSDTGYGIPKHLQPNVFTKFFRADNILLRDVTGTGLGLYLTKMIADNLNGDLWFKSIENKGSTFNFSFPKYAIESK